MSVTQKAIADKLNISQAHVARALGQGKGRVSEETRRLIEATALEMGYDRYANVEARAMVGKRYSRRPKTNIVAVALPIPAGVTPRQIPFYHVFLEGVQSEATTADGCEVCIVHKLTEEIPKLLRSSVLDGAIVAGFTREQIQTIQSSNLSVVTYQASYPGSSSIRPDDHAGMYKATRHLLELGHRNIAYIGALPNEENHETLALRLEGYRDALIEAGIPIREEWIETSLQIPVGAGNQFCRGCESCAACAGWSTLKAKLGLAADERPPFTAVVCHNDPVGMGVIRQAEKSGLNVPRDLSVTGFDNLSDHYKFHPRITSVGCSHFEMGRNAMRLLRNAIDEGMSFSREEKTLAEKQVFSVELTIGESTAVPR